MKTTTVRLSETAHERLEKLCQFYGYSQSDLFRYLIEAQWQRVGDQAERIAQFAAKVRQEVE
jgi:predicted DNA-binding protein